MGFKQSSLLLNIFIFFLLFGFGKGQIEQRNRGNVQRNILDVLSKDDSEGIRYD